MIYSSWDIECDRLKLVILGHFCPFTLSPPKKTNKQTKNKKVKILKKWKQTAEDTIILHICTKNYNHLIRRDWQIFLVILVHFCPFTPLTTQKIKHFKKIEKKTLRDITILQIFNHKWQSYDVWFLRYGVRQIFFCHFGLFSALLPL